MPDKNEKILVIKLGALGDFVQSLGAMRAIYQHHQDGEITLLTTKPFKDFAEKSGYFHHIKIDIRPKFYQLYQWFKLKNWFNHNNFARVYDLQNNDRTEIYFNLFSPKPEWVGVAKGASHRNTSLERTKGLAFYGHQSTLALVGINNITIDKMDWIKADTSKFNINDSYALIIPGSSPSHLEKRWPIKNYIGLCQYLNNNNIQPVLIGTKDEKNILGDIEKNCPNSLNLCSKTTLFDLVVLARNAKLCIGNDTGPMHIVAPTGCKTLVLFSKYSNPIRHAPLGEYIKTIQKEDLNNLSVDEVIKNLNHFS